MQRSERNGLGILILALAASSPLAAAQEEGARREVAAATLTGGVDTFTPANAGRAHVSGSIGLDSSEYFRGAYDNLEEDLDQIGLTTELGGTIELRPGSLGPLAGLTLSLGTGNDIATSDDRPGLDDEDGHWYESNWFAGLAGRIGDDWLASLTYTAYGTPADDYDFIHEAAVATQYAGDNAVGELSPEFKIAAPFAADDDEAERGLFTAVSITPETELEGSGSSVTLAFPLEIGVGFDDYYGQESGSAGYARAAVSATKPLDAIPSGYGDWSVKGELSLLARDDDLRATEPDFADDTWVASASVSLTLIY